MMGNCCKPFWIDRRQFSRRHRKKIVLLLVGLDNAGKTSAAKSLVGGSLESVVPTVGFSSVTLQHRGYSVIIYDLGGGPQIRGIWQRYFNDVHGVIFVVDASDVDRLEECGQVLEELLTNEKLAGKPVLLLANKQDNEGALDELDVVERLRLEALVNRQRCPTMVETCSTNLDKKHIDPAIQNGFKWLVTNIIQDYGILNARVESDLGRQRILDEEVRRERRERILKLREQRGDKPQEETVLTTDPFQPISQLAAGKKRPVGKQPANDQPPQVQNGKSQTTGVADTPDPRVILVQESPKKYNNSGTLEPRKPGSGDSSTLSARLFSGDGIANNGVALLNNRNANLTDYVKGQLEIQKTTKKHNPLRRSNKTAPVDSDSDSLSVQTVDTIRNRPLTPLTLTPRTLTPLALKPKLGVLPPLRVPKDPFVVRPSSGEDSGTTNHPSDSAWGLDKPLDSISANQKSGSPKSTNQLQEINSDSEDVIC